MELTGYLAVARRWWWTLLVATWVAGVSGWIVASQIAPTYEAETQLLVGPYNTDRETLQAAGDLVQTYSQLVTTTPLLESAIAEVGATITAADLNLATRVTANDTTRFLTIRVQDTNPRTAARLANALADEIAMLTSRTTNRPEGQLQVVDFAVAPTEPVAPQKSLIVGLAALAALVGAMVLVMLVEYLSAAVRTEDELARLTGLPFIGKVETTRSLPSGARDLIDQTPDSAAAAAYRLVVAKVAFHDRGRPARSIVVVGTGSDGTNAQVAANLAAITARSGRQVILVDTDTGNASATRIFSLEDRTGLTDLVTTPEADVANWLVRISSTLRVMPSGTAPDEDAVDVGRASALLAAFASRAELVVVATGAVHLSAGALVWAKAGDAAIIVATRDQARRDDVEYAADSLRMVEAGVAGTVFAERKRGIRRGRPPATLAVEHARPVGREPAVEHGWPVTQPVYAGEPNAREPVYAREPDVREPVYAREPVAREPVYVREPVAREPVYAREPDVRETFVREPEVREPLVRKPVVRKPAVRKRPEAAEAPDEDVTPTATTAPRRTTRRRSQTGERGA